MEGKVAVGAAPASKAVFPSLGIGFDSCVFLECFCDLGVAQE